MRYPLLAACLGLCVSAQAESLDARIAEGTALIPAFQKHLLETVQGAMRQGGPAQAVAACQTLAPGIAEAHGQDGWRVGRTALKVRNPANAPDAWEREVLEDFARRAQAGEPLAGMQRAEVVDGEVRVMKPIATGAPCLACHGTQVELQLARLIRERYPDDQATGFREGELRGAFTLRRPVADEG